VLNENSLKCMAEYQHVNVEGTSVLARQAAAVGVRRFVFLSSIKVNVEFTELGQAFTAEDVPAPRDPYGVSKHEAK
jgi:nucleoside-diphosphate-sugar epimerase